MKKINKKSMFFLGLVIIVIGITGFNMKSGGESYQKIEKIPKPVKVREVKYEFVSTELDYIGTVNSKGYTKYSSEICGKINEIFVEKGDFVDEGDKLFGIDKSNLSFALESGKLKLNQSSVELEKSKENMDYLNSNLERAYELYTVGGLSKNDYEDMELKYDLSLRTFENAKSNYELAKISLDKNQNDFNNRIVKTKKVGVVSEIIVKEGEIIDAGTPVIILRDDIYVINIGVSEEDLENINIGDSVKINIDEVYSMGIISEINDLPDNLTGLYLVQIQLEHGHYIIGKMGKATFNVDKKKGVKIPLSAIGVEDYDYVFLLKNGKAVKQKIEIIGRYKDFVLINGVEENSEIVIEGMRALNDGDLIRNLE